MHLALCIVVLAWSSLAGQTPAPQRADYSKLIEAMDKNGCVVHEDSGVKVCKRDYSVDGKNLEAISFEPKGNRPFPALLLIPDTREPRAIGFPTA